MTAVPYITNAPLTGTTFSVPAGTELYAMNPAGLLAAHTVNFPPNPKDQQPFTVSSTQTITALTLLTIDGSSILNLITTLPLGGSARWVFSVPANKWINS